ncbi:hypothetical protein [Clostridium sp. AWRP]|uniref:hypothetical protein n=1 Tax=Clostridium sp. AWRP TaxID=2212991 RepID=UPI000FD7DA81|nr:hypothetical protein [Clostridium sp. AWRP]AZV56443.1 hypothetical protein DMR38_07390 [Clostridium sp. AWRP]
MNNEEKILKLLEDMQSQVNENTQVLKALEHKVDIIKAEQDNMKHELTRISEDTKSIKNLCCNNNFSICY